MDFIEAVDLLAIANSMSWNENVLRREDGQFLRILQFDVEDGRRKGG